jgi:hypothetical protein
MLAGEWRDYSSMNGRQGRRRGEERVEVEMNGDGVDREFGF